MGSNNNAKNKKRNYKGGKSNYRSTRTQNENLETKPYDSHKGNDINWWNKSPMYEEATRLPFNYITGGVYDYSDLLPVDSDGVKCGTLVGDNYKSIANIMRIEIMPTIGFAVNANSPVNRAFTSLYAALYSKTTGAMQFQPNDLALISLAADSILSNIALAKRCLGLAKLYSDVNYSYPKDILESMFIDSAAVDDLIKNQDLYRSQLNDIILNLTAMRIPKFITVFDRHYSLFHNLYLDEPTVNAAVYYFWPKGYYVYKEAGEDGDASKLQGEVFYGSSMSEILDAINEQLSAIRLSSSFGLVAGTVMRAFPSTATLTLDYVKPDTVWEPVYDMNINAQIMNMSQPVKMAPNNCTIVGDPLEGIVKCQISVLPWALDPGYVTAKRQIINSVTGDTSAEFVMEATRLMIHVSNPQAVSDLDVVGTEIPTGIQVFHKMYSLATGSTTLEMLEIGDNGISDDSSQLWDACRQFDALSFFRFAPKLMFQTTDSNDVVRQFVISKDLYTYTTIDGDALKRLHEAALQSAYTSAIGSFVDAQIK